MKNAFLFLFGGIMLCFLVVSCNSRNEPIIGENSEPLLTQVDPPPIVITIKLTIASRKKDCVSGLGFRCPVQELASPNPTPGTVSGYATIENGQFIYFVDESNTEDSLGNPIYSFIENDSYIHTGEVVEAMGYDQVTVGAGTINITYTDSGYAKVAETITSYVVSE